MSDTVCHFNWEGQEILAKPLTHLREHLAFIATEEERDFRDYLSSPFLVQEKRLSILFEYTYPKLIKQHQTRLLLKPLLQQLYDKSKDQLNTYRNQQLTRWLRLLADHVLTFKAQLHLRQKPVEQYRLRAEAFRAVSKDFFELSARQWQKEIDAMPHGTLRYLHQWRLAHHTYINPLTPKQQVAPEKLEQLLHHFVQLRDYLNAFYRSELLARRETFYDSLSLAIPQEKKWPLLQIFELLVQMRQQKAFQDQAYQKLKTLFVKEQNHLSDDQHYALWQLIINYLNKHYENGRHDLSKELAYWQYYQLDNHVMKLFSPLPVSILLSSLTIAFLDQDLTLVQRLTKEQVPLIPPTYRKVVRTFIASSYCFEQRRYLLCTRLLTDIVLPQRSDNYILGIRIKSMIIRAYLGRLNNRNDPCIACVDRLEAELANFSKYIYRQTGRLSPKHQAYLQRFIEMARLSYQEIISPEKANTERLTQAWQERLPFHASDWFHDFFQLK